MFHYRDVRNPKQGALTSKDLYRAIFLLALVGVAGFFLRDVLRFLVLLLIAAQLALALAGGAKLLGKVRVPRIVGVLLTLLVLTGVFVAILYALLPPLLDQLMGLLTSLPGILASAQQQLQPSNTPPVVSALISQLQQRVTELLSTFTFDPI